MVLPPGADVENVKQVLARYHRGFETVENRHVSKLLKPREIYISPSPKHCDCGTALGSTRRLTAGEEAPGLTREVNKRKRKGWSEAKIARWQEQLENNRRANAEREENTRETGADLDGWVNIIRDFHADVGLGYVGILLHWYRGGLSERIDVTRKKLRFDDHIKASLGSIEEDVLYLVTWS